MRYPQDRKDSLVQDKLLTEKGRASHVVEIHSDDSDYETESDDDENDHESDSDDEDDDDNDSPCQGQNFPEHQDGNIAPDPPAKRKLTFGGCDYDPVGGSHTNPTSPSRHVHQPETSDEI